MFRVQRWPASVSRLVAVVAMVAPVVLLPTNAFAAAGQVCVNPGGTGGCKSSISAAVAALPHGGRIDIQPGTYKEDVAVTTSNLILHGASANSTIIDGSDQSWALELHNNSNLIIENLTFENANLAGVLFDNVSNAQFRNNHVTKNDVELKPGPVPNCEPIDQMFPGDDMDCGEGVTIAGLRQSILDHNQVDGNAGGILVSDEHGQTRDNIISNNDVSNNRLDCGLTLASHSANQVFNNLVVNNTVSGNGAAGIGLFGPAMGTGVHDNVIRNNTATGNGIPGVTMHAHVAGENMNGNQIIGNTLSGNGADFEPGTTTVPTGIEIFAAPSADPVKNTVILSNKFKNEKIDVWIGANNTSADVHFNDLVGGAGVVGVQNAGTGVVHAQLNYWGCSTGPNTNGCSTTSTSPAGGAIQTTPFLTHPV
jgi:hypothetical protein